ncbi:MgtC/SapB family protein [candidate division KSB1 bacterium]
MISDFELIIRLFSAVVVGGLIGFEREIRHKSAGFRTNILICLGSALFTLISIKVTSDYTTTVADPGRIAAQIVTGIGFLGAGAIMHSRGSVTGLTTAATIWVTAALGMAIGMGYYHVALITAVVAITVLQALVPIELRMRRSRQNVHYYIKYTRNDDIDRIIKNFYQTSYIELDELGFNVHDSSTEVKMIVRHKPADHIKFKDMIKNIDDKAVVVDI